VTDTLDAEKKEANLIRAIREAGFVSEQQQKYILASKNDKLIVQLSKRHDLSYDTGNAICKLYYKSPSKLISLARNSSAPSLVLEALYKHPSPEIRRALAANPIVPIGVKRDIFYHDSDKVVRNLVRNLL
jgi:hypothetical protein